ncbi:MAG: nuclear transport factor 2 family protein [Verrucomicrobiales bacterium]
MARRPLLYLAAAGAALLSFGGCLALKPHQMDNSAIEAYATAAKKTDSGTTAPGTSTQQGIERWKALLADLSEENIRGKTSSVYADKFFFNDTLKTLHGPEELEDYLLETAEMLQYGRVSYEDVAISGDDVYIRWRMVYRSKKLNKKQDIDTIGVSHLRFDSAGKVVLHQDFWDSTRGIFEHVPLVGSGIRAVKKRL